MNPFKLYAKFDEWMVGRLNEIYLWALDWTGVYVGSILFVISIPATTNMILKDHTWIAAIFFIFSVLIAAPRYIFQGLGPEPYNKLVLNQPGMFHFRLVFLLLNLSMLPLDFTQNRVWLEVTVDFCNILVWYVFEFKIRDREKKKLEFKALIPAMQGSR